MEDWDWVKISASEAMMLVEVMTVVVESQSQKLMSRLRESLGQAILGGVDGFLNTVTGSLSARRPACIRRAP